MSVLEQNYPNIEYIIMDGGSTDNSVEIIKKYENYLAHWASERDAGQAHAINKGLAMATGEVFNWINSDDFLEPGALQEIGHHFLESPHTDVYCGYTRCFYDEDNVTSHEYRMGLKASVAKTILDVEMNQPGSFYRTARVKEFGGVNESLRYVFDDELWFRYLCAYGLEGVKRSEKRFAQFRLHGNSKSMGEGFEGFHSELQSIFIDIAKDGQAPKWLISKMKEGSHSFEYETSGKWNLHNLNKNEFQASFASAFINSLYLSGQKKIAKEAMNMAVKNGYFKWNRMMLSLRTKLFFTGL